MTNAEFYFKKEIVDDSHVKDFAMKLLQYKEFARLLNSDLTEYDIINNFMWEERDD